MGTTKKRNRLPALAGLLLTGLCMAGTVWICAAIEAGTQGASDGTGLDMSRIERDIRVLAAHASRMSGSPGAESAFDYIRSELERVGVTRVTVQEFPVVVPRGVASFLNAGEGESAVVLPVHALWPNLARTGMTGPSGLRGKLIDAGGGTESELQGKDLAGALVVMDWDCDLEWLSVPEFGGGALVFRGDVPAGGRVARRKFLSMPADIPRYYVASKDVPALEAALALDAHTTLTCDSQWQQVTARNLKAEVCPGMGDSADPDQSAIVLHAYYDSVSVVPDLAPGAEQSCGAATLLELARYFAVHPASRPVQVLFTGGHGQALAGMTHYIRQLQTPGVPQPGLMLGLDLSSHSDAFGVFCLGHFRGQLEGSIRHKFSLLGSTLADFARAYKG
ncbi:MAG: M28 family peptidase, partial [Verrucomicrobia bacterium]|nr:M28 family peptidase [Verrucomicrobiota bacterium]